MRLPTTIPADSLSDFYYKDQIKIKGHWYILKPKSSECWCILKRIKMAWAVFTGQTDILKYEEVKDIR